MHDNTQIIFVDTPGIHKKERLLNKYMMDEALKAIGDSDLIIYLSAITDKLTDYEKFLEMIEGKNKKHIVVLTKMDHASQGEVLKKLGEYQKYQDKFEAIVPFSVKKNVGRKALLDEISRLIPESPFLFETDILTTEYIRDIYKELIRESVFENLSDEIPYESDVVVQEVVESENLDKVSATIIVEKEVQKRMIVGTKGEGIKRVGIVARKMMERFSGKKIYLDLRVSVRKGWSKNRDALGELGYSFE